MKLLFCDLDDTLLKADPQIAKVKKRIGDEWKVLTSEEYAKDKVDDPRAEYDLSDFYDHGLMYDQIIKAAPILSNLKVMDEYAAKGYKIAFLTARGAEDAVRRAVKEWLKVRDVGGDLKNVNGYFSDSFSMAINDEKYSKIFSGLKDHDKKADVIKQAAAKCEEIVFMDDDDQNLDAVKKLRLKNVKVIKSK